MRRLTDRDKLILTALHLNAGDDLVSVAAALKLPHHQVRYVREQLIEEGILRRRAVVNISALGYAQYTFYVSLNFASQASRDRWSRSMLEHPSVISVYDLTGDFTAGITFVARNPNEALELWNSTCGAPSLGVRDRIFGIRTRLTMMRRRIWSQRRFAPDSYSVPWSDKPIELDESMRSVLDVFSTGNASRREMARSIDMPQASFEMRLKRLRESGVIVREVYGIYAEKLGYLSFRILIRFRRSLADAHAKLEKFVSANPNVYLLIDYLGDWDAELVAEVLDPREITTLRQHLDDLLGNDLDSARVLHLLSYRKIVEYPRELV